MASPPPTANRPPQIGAPSGPSAPYPLRMQGTVISGFGRGSKELGIPTANLPVDEAQTPWIGDAASGVYFGWAALGLPASHPDSISESTSTAGEADGRLKGAGEAGGSQGPEGAKEASKAEEDGATKSGATTFQIYPMVMSIGYNPFYKNTVRSAEVHVLHRFQADFYGVEMRLLITGFIREEKDYSGLEALIADIEFDCDVAKRSLAREAWAPRGVDVRIEMPGGEGVRMLKGGLLDCAWLVRPSELPKEEEGK